MRRLRFLIRVGPCLVIARAVFARVGRAFMVSTVTAVAREVSMKGGPGVGARLTRMRRTPSTPGGNRMGVRGDTWC